MFQITDDGRPYRVAGIDPGTDTLGFSVLDLNLLTNEVSIVQTMTLQGSAMIKPFKSLVDVHGSRFVRLRMLESTLLDLFQQYQPTEIACEKSYYNPRRPNAYGALVEAISCIRNAGFNYDQFCGLCMVDAARVKTALGVSGKSGDKDKMKQAVMARPDILNPNNFNISLLDEHSIDSMAIAYSHLCTVRF